MRPFFVLFVPFMSYVFASPNLQSETLTIEDFGSSCLEEKLPPKLCNFSLTLSAESTWNSTAKLCLLLHYNVKEMCQPNKGLGSSYPVREGEDVCQYLKNQFKAPTCSSDDIFCAKAAKEVESIEEDCKTACSSEQSAILCQALLVTFQKLSPKLGENGHGVPPLLLGKPNSEIKGVSEKVNHVPDAKVATTVKVEPPVTLTKEDAPEKLEEAPEQIEKIDSSVNYNTTTNSTAFSIPSSTEIDQEFKKEMEKQTAAADSFQSAINGISEPPVYEDKLNDVDKEENLDIKGNEVNSNMADMPQQPIVLDDHMNEEQALEAQSKFFSYFVILTILCIVAYLVFHNKKKILALILEGRRKNQQGRGRRSSSSAQYRKLDNNLEEAMGSNSDDSLRHVIY